MFMYHRKIIQAWFALQIIVIVKDGIVKTATSDSWVWRRKWWWGDKINDDIIHYPYNTYEWNWVINETQRGDKKILNIIIHRN